MSQITFYFVSITVGKEGTKCIGNPRASHALANTSVKNYNANTFSSILCYEVYFDEIVRDFLRTQSVWKHTRGVLSSFQ